MPTRHQFTNLPLFIAFSFLGLTRAAIEDPISNLRERVADIDGGQTSAALEGIIANLRDRVGDVDRGQTSASIVFASCFISTTCVLNGRKVMTQIL